MFAPRGAADVHPKQGLHTHIHVDAGDLREVIAKAVGVALRDMRVRAGLDLTQAGKLMNVNGGNVRAHECGGHSMRIDTLISYVRGYNGSLLEIERAVERALAGQAP